MATALLFHTLHGSIQQRKVTAERRADLQGSTAFRVQKAAGFEAAERAGGVALGPTGSSVLPALSRRACSRRGRCLDGFPAGQRCLCWERPPERTVPRAGPVRKRSGLLWSGLPLSVKLLTPSSPPFSQMVGGPGPESPFSGLFCQCLVLTIRKHLVVQNGLHGGSDLRRCPWPPDPMKGQEGLLAHRARLYGTSRLGPRGPSRLCTYDFPRKGSSATCQRPQQSIT